MGLKARFEGSHLPRNERGGSRRYPREVFPTPTHPYFVNKCRYFNGLMYAVGCGSNNLLGLFADSSATSG